LLDYLEGAKEIVGHFKRAFMSFHEPIRVFAVDPYPWIYNLMGIKNHHKSSHTTHSQLMEYQFDVVDPSGETRSTTVECGVTGLTIHDEDRSDLASHYLSLKYGVRILEPIKTWEFVHNDVRIPYKFDDIKWTPWDYGGYRYEGKMLHFLLPREYLEMRGFGIYVLRGTLSLRANGEYYHIRFVDNKLELEKYIPDPDDLTNCRYYPVL
jgi:hypothetical protein